MNMESYTVVWVDDSDEKGKKLYAKYCKDPKFEQWFISQGA